MIKKLLALVIAVLLAVSLTACFGGDDNGDDNGTGNGNGYTPTGEAAGGETFGDSPLIGRWVSDDDEDSFMQFNEDGTGRIFMEVSEEDFDDDDDLDLGDLDLEDFELPFEWSTADGQLTISLGDMGEMGDGAMSMAYSVESDTLTLTYADEGDYEVSVFTRAE